MTYYTLPKLFKYNNNNNINIIQFIKFSTSLKNSNDNNSLLETMLNNMVTDENKNTLNDIKNKYSFTDLLNLKLSDEIYHPKSYFAFIEINKICKIFHDNKLVTMHMSDTHDYLDGLYQLRLNKDKYIFISELYHNNIPHYITLEQLYNNSTLNNCINKYNCNVDLISINHDNIHITIKRVLLALIFQKLNGNLIIKFKRLNLYVVKEIIYILLTLYDNVLIIKPKIVNSVNEYKYIVATNLIHNIDKNMYVHIFNIISKIDNIDNDKIISRILSIDLPQILVNKIDECELIMSENILITHMKILNSIHINNINIKSVEKKIEHDSKQWLKDHN